MKRLIVRKSLRLASRQRGTIILFAMLALLIVSMLGASLVRTVAVSHQQLLREQLRMQAVWLAESGCDRAVSQLRRSSAYMGEVWSVPAEQLSADRTAVVRIRVEADPKSEIRRIVAVTAEYPAASSQAVRISRQISVALSTGNKP
jgi:type II secretory pathway component PulK